MKEIFKRFADDVGYGYILPRATPADKGLDLAIFYASAGLAIGGVITASPGVAILGSYLLVASVNKFAFVGQGIRERLDSHRAP